MNYFKKLATVLAAIIMAAAGPMALPGMCDPGEQLHAPTKLPMPKNSAVGQDDDILLVMPAGDADKDEVNESLKKVNGTVVGTIGDGPMTILKVKIERAKFLETEK